MRTVHGGRRSLRLAGCTIGLMAAACAQSPDPNPQKPGTPKTAPESAKPDKPQANRGAGAELRLRRLESVTWNPVTQELTWVLSTGDLNASGYSPNKRESYVIHMDAATMRVEGEDRRFDPEEAEQVGKVMDLICRYALESTLWWEHGGGEKVEHGPAPNATDPTGNPAPKDKADPDKTRKVPPGMLRGSAPDGAGPVQATRVVVTAPGRQ